MYPKVTVKGSTGLLVILLVFSEVHSFIFEDEGGTDFCSAFGNIHQNESTRKWLESSCNVGRTMELNNLMLSVRNNKIPREDSSRTPMFMRERSVTQTRLDKTYRTSRLSDQVRQQKVETYRTPSNRGGNDITRKLVRNDNRRVREERYSSRESGRLDIHRKKTSSNQSARLNVEIPSRSDNVRTARSLNKSEVRSRRSDVIVSRSVDNSVPKSNEKFSRRSTQFSRSNEMRSTRIDRRLDNRVVRLSEDSLSRLNRLGSARSMETEAFRSTREDIRASRSPENRYMESYVIRHVRSTSVDAFRFPNERRSGIRASRSVETRSIDDNRSVQFDNLRRSTEDQAARSTEIRSTRSYDSRSKSTENIASLFEENRNRRSATRFTTTKSNEGIRFYDNRVAESVENRAARSVDMRNVRLSRSRSTGLPDIRTTRSRNSVEADSNRNIRISRSDDSLNLKLEKNRASRFPANNFDDIRTIRSAENRETELNSRLSRTIRIDGIRATRTVLSPQMARSSRSRENELDENRSTRSFEGRRSIKSNSGLSTRSVDVRATRSVEIRSTIMTDTESRLLDEYSARSNAKFSGVSVNSRLIRSNDHSMLNEDRRNVDYRNERVLKEKMSKNMASRSDKIILVGSGEKISNDKMRAVRNTQSARSNTRRSVIRNTTRREPLAVIRDIRSGRDILLYARSEGISSSLRRSIPNEREDRSRSDISSRSNDRKLSLSYERFSGRNSAQDVRGNEQSQRISAHVRVSRTDEEFQRSDIAGRRTVVPLGEDESRRFSQGRRQAPMVAMENSQVNERNSRSIVRSRLVGETGMNSQLAGIEGSRLERIREFGNDNRQRQIRSDRNINQNRRTRDERETLAMTNLRNTLVPRRLGVIPSRFRDNNEIRMKFERSREISRQRMMLRNSDMETAAPLLNNRKLRIAHRQHDLEKVERNSIDTRLMMRKNNADESRNSRRIRLDYREEVFGVFDLPRSTATHTRRRNVRSIDNVRGRREQDDARMAHKIAINSGRRGYSKISSHRNVNRDIWDQNTGIDNMNYRSVSGRETFLDLGRKTENLRNVRFGRTYDNFRKMGVKQDSSFKEGLFGMSSNTALQVTLASILVGQLIFSKLGSSKGSYCTVNWITKLKSF